MTTRKLLNVLTLLTVAFAVLAASHPASARAALINSSGTPVGNRDDFTGTVGSNVTTGGANVVVNALGYQDPGGDGLVISHQVGLWNNAGALLDSVVVPAGTGATLIDDWRYVSLAAPITLLSGQSYRVGALVTSGSGDGWTDTAGGAASFAYDASVAAGSPPNVFVAGSFAFPSNDGTLTALRWAPGNATFIPIPEPSTIALFALGLSSLGFVSWRRRNR